MHVYLVEYDLNRPGQNYPELIAAIKSFPEWCHHLRSAWLVVSPLSAENVRSFLLPHIDGGDDLIVVDVSGAAAAWYGFSDQLSGWIKDRLERAA